MDDIGKKILLSAGITLGVAVSGVSLYLLFKPEDDQYLKADDRKDQRKVRQANQALVTVRVPMPCVGTIIGRGGEQIKKLQAETQTRIDFSKETTDANDGKDKNGHKEYRILLIRGAPENAAKAEAFINEIIGEQAKSVTKHFSVDTNAIGNIIGRNGDNIRGISEKSGAKVKVDRKNPKGSTAIMTSIWITGTEEQIAEAVLLINSEIANCQNFSRHSSQNSRQNQLTGYKLFAIEDEPIENKIDFESYYAKLEPTSHNQTLEVFVSAVNSPDDFYVQLCSNGVDLDRLMDDTTDFYEIEDNFISFKPMSVKVGDIVSVPYQFDEHWYRAKVLTTQDKPYSLEESDVRVFYLDYGDEALLKYSQICDLKDELLRRMPFQAIQCCLSGVGPIGANGWTEEAIAAFKELTHNALWKPLYAKVIDIQSVGGKRNKYRIELYDKISVDRQRDSENNDDEDWESPKVSSINVNIGHELIKRHLALPRQ